MINAVPFQRGDLVQRSSGGPRMMVEEVENPAGTIIRCKWYEGRERYVDRFFVEALQRVPNGDA